ncbi:MAG: peptide-methionine (R)-S-oxide reductase [Moritella sp.]|uniref:peptide-methionine (R)-S-oxide reductase n=1 Tax=Moritella sp. TaxID=78556 RepID=UPI0029A8224F|nr:peptide-methionine (R)-S-oxide reductase [Moritella sp.]MDX2319693.1 peptide-methionine (R)-S-oxide reductase [Moritella sp.]
MENKSMGKDSMKKDMTKTDAEWQTQLTDEEFHVCRKKGTEHPYTGTLLNNNDVGVYKCKCCGSELFTSDSKFNSGCGWPSFDKEINDGAVVYNEDNS